MNVKRVMIAAPKSGSGKTMITCALLKALKNRGEKAVSFKCGPDYIDPMFHHKAIGIPSGNLDTFFTDGEQTRRLLLDGAADSDIAVLEGVMGLFDGLGGVREEGSSYNLAQVTKTPIILVADAKGMGRSVIPLLSGFLKYDKDGLIRGVILNRMSEGYYKVIKPLIEKELQIPVLGYFPELKELGIESRHLGLIMPDEMEDIRERLKKASRQLEKTVSVDRIMDIAGLGEELTVRDGKSQQKGAGIGGCSGRYGHGRDIGVKKRPVIAVAKDEAFCFYYRENLKMLEEYGADVVYFSPLRQRKVPDNCHGILMGGGYPELYARELSENETMRESVRQAVKRGMPVVAECGGFMYLHQKLTDKDGVSHAMAGVLPASCFYTGKLVRFGYIEIEEKKSIFLLEGQKIRGHEFHYYDSEDNGSGAVVIKPAAGKTYSCIVENEHCWMGFPHLYYPSNDEFVKAFIKKMS